ncbi:MAG: hypothetical protein KAW41_02575 [Candidatus Diapherotrites archaeon]|nr:hypothetical protein [Candidatus Diapherotrites archaeon]
MKRLVLLLIIASLALAQCTDNGICEPEEKPFGCPDCSFGSVCVDDGKCTSVEIEAGCSDCSTTKVAKCVDNGVCSKEEKSLGNCNDCKPKGIDTGLLLLAGGIGLFGFMVIGVILVIIVALYMLSQHSNRRIRM